MAPALRLASRSPSAAILFLSTSLLLSACLPAPGRVAPSEPRAPEPPQQTVYIVLGDPPDTPPGDWVPEEAHGDNPFERTRTWLGDYDCPQGTTDMTLRVIGVHGDTVRVVFGFHHVDSGVKGSYLMSGRYDEETRTAAFTAGAWLEQPPNYVTVGMRGDVALDGSLFAGRIEHPLCGAFRLRPAS